MKLKKSLIAMATASAVVFSGTISPVHAQETTTTEAVTETTTTTDEVVSVETDSDKTAANTTATEKPGDSKKESTGSSTSNVLDTIRGIFGYKKSDDSTSDSDASGEDKPESKTDTILSWIKLVSVVITTLTGLVTLISKVNSLN